MTAPYNKRMILGIDEVGRGPWAGPLVVAAVVLPEGLAIEGLTDSKKVSKKRRDELDGIIRSTALGYGIGWVHADELDDVGLSEALRLATRRAVDQVTIPYHEIIIDGTINFLKGTKKGEYVTTLPKADLLIPAVSAASIIAKVARDAFMADQDTLFPGYSFISHVGYGTAAHRQAIEQHGVTPLHRLSFAPLVVYKDVASASTTSTTKEIGTHAEECTTELLEAKGHVIHDRNWRTPRCEIDIVSSVDGVYYFTEVKYRRNMSAGGAVSAISPKKLCQMTFAAQCYVASHNLRNDYQLAYATIDGVGGPAVWQAID